MIKTIDIAWLGGLIEGEGCFYLSKGKYPLIVLGMTDGDVVTKVAAMWGTNVHRHRSMYTTQVNGARAISWMMTLYPLLHERRKEKVTKIVKFWKEHTYSQGSDGIQRAATCHPDRLIYAFGLCRFCYKKQYYRKKQLLKKVG